MGVAGYIRIGKFFIDRDAAILLLASINEFFLSLDTYLAHDMDGTIRPYEWIPILFGIGAGILLLSAGLIAYRRQALARVLATVILGSSIGVGILGTYFHAHRAFQPDAPIGLRVSWEYFAWAPPVLAPLAFTLVGIMGISAAWPESPPGSGILRLSQKRTLSLPFAKRQAYCFLVSFGIIIGTVSATLDHARSGFLNPWVWLPLVGGSFCAAVTFGFALLDKPTIMDRVIYIGTLIFLVLLGIMGLVLHIQTNLSGVYSFVPERFLRGAPVLAPLLFTNIGIFGALALWEKPSVSEK